jgi:hypothetical protein
MIPPAASFASTPEIFPHVLEAATDRVLLSRLTEQDYANASFLDERILKAGAPTNPIDFGTLQSVVTESKLEPSAHFIFHIGHVGSTLLSRLLGIHPDVFALREPAILRTVAQIRLEAANAPPYWQQDQFDARFLTLLKLLSRTFRPSQRAIIKVTSFASELAKLALSLSYKPRAIFMFMPAEQYLAAILGAENSPREAQTLAPMRLARLNNRLGTQFILQGMSIGEIVAMSWACEMTTLVQAAAHCGERVLWLDFDKFLAQPQSLLGQSFAHFDVTASDRQINDILTSPDMRRYSKAPEHQYDTALRNAVLNQGRQMFGAEISRGLRWLENTAPSHPPLAQAMALSPTS